MVNAPVPRRPLLAASLRGVAAVWVWRRVEAEAAEGPANVAHLAGPAAGRELALALAELREAARQWGDRGAGDDAAFADESVKAVVGADGAPSVGMDEFTMTEAAAVLHVSPQWVGQLRRDGRLSGRRVGQSWLIDRGSVMDLLDARRSA
jgi:excisionase family DNA binding protein